MLKSSRLEPVAHESHASLTRFSQRKEPEAVGHGMEKSLDVDLQALSQLEHLDRLQARLSRISLEWLGGMDFD